MTNLRLNFLQFASLFSARIKTIIAGYNKSLPDEIRPFIEDNLWLARNPAYPKRYTNRTNKLYNRTGNLAAALRVNNVGNIFNVINKKDSSEVEYGINLTRIPYAQYHEFGTSKMRARPFIKPGIESFRRERLKILQNKLVDDIKKAWNK
jgi:HK97 gp10 family phage protein